MRFRNLELPRGIPVAYGALVRNIRCTLKKEQRRGAWDDPGMDRIYDELRAEFDLVDRYQALEMKLRSVQEALELILDVARDRRLVWLEITIVALIVLEILLSLLHR